MSTNINVQRLLDAMADAESKVHFPTGAYIERYPDFLIRMMEDPKKSEVGPRVVSIGPYHNGRPDLTDMEYMKKVFTKRFTKASPVSINLLYNKVEKIAMQAKECYSQSHIPSHLTTDQIFVDVMFFDGCFLLHLMDLLNEGMSLFNLTGSSQVGRCILNDIIMTENQLPFMVLTTLMRLKHVDINKFIDKNYNPFVNHDKDVTTSTFQIPTTQPPLHLLDLIRMKIVFEWYGNSVEEQSPFITYNSSMHSAIEHMEVGIRIRGIKTTDKKKGFDFKKGFFHGYLSLPELYINEYTWLLFDSLLHLEDCGYLGYKVTSYFWFMCQLIQGPYDVLSLRAGGVMLNTYALGSDPLIAAVFNDWGRGTKVNPKFYLPVVNEIEEHYKNRVKLYVIKRMKVHFSQWGTNPIAFAAATFLLILTIVQTIFTVRSSNRGS